ncbi:MAG: 3'-5' exonuclease [Candidatus Pacebacteria bacterium]|nr:3'-5' exonuclease [Candidatus Paceibacterota bacterium]
MIVVDIETSGVDPIKNSILSIGAIDFLDSKRTFYEECRTFEGAHISEESLAINGYTKEEAGDSKKQSDKEILEHFLAWALLSKDHTLAGQNPSFDRDFLRYTAERYHLNWPLTHRTIDLHSICYFHMKRQGIEPPFEKNRSALNLDAILTYLGLPEESKPHIAINGARLEAECFSRLFYEKSFFPEYKNFKIPWVSAKRA